MAKEQRRAGEFMSKCVYALCCESNGAVNEETGFDKLKMVTGGFYLPKTSEKRPLGQEAHFYLQNKQSIGVADGVTSKSEERIANDSGISARELMSNCVAALRRQSNEAVNPKQELKSAHFKTTSKGSSTVCIVSLNGNPDEGEFEVKARDIVVLGTDGLLDNLFTYEIEDVLQNLISCGTDPQQSADTIGAAAKANSRNRLSNSPFSVAAKLAGFEYVGGKYDDITVVAARIEYKNQLLHPNIKEEGMLPSWATELLYVKARGGIFGSGIPSNKSHTLYNNTRNVVKE
ncbi:unnamed protein product [Dovyalis caffra]|uniref:Protein phosphatase n=1 Tax=Dovyalis caffra TaxID=77055 RepID=A0AAV1RA78_9ROSI|nr:unnamed protein product [Dovyalis caffra]